MAWKADLKMWALQWDKEKSARENDNRLSSKQIESGCPKCGNEAFKIEYWNCGPIVRIRCPKCGFACNEHEGREKGYEDIFDYWNHLNSELKEDK